MCIFKVFRKKRGFKIVVQKNKIGEPYIKLCAANGETIMSGEGYSSNQAMEKTLNMLLGMKLPDTFEDKR